MSPALQHARSIQKICQAIVRKGDTPDTNIFVVSTGDRDRDNDTLDPNGWDLKAFEANPIILYGHSHTDLPIAKCTSIKVVNGQLQAEFQWPPAGLYEFADTVKGMARAGFIQSTSVGFRGLEWTPNAYGGRDYTHQQLIEVSLVPIPSNPNVRMVKGVDTMQLKSWLGHSWREQSKEDTMQIADDRWLEVSDDFFTKAAEDAFAAMCREMLAAYEEFGSHKFTELMAAQFILHPELNAAVTQALQSAGVYAPKYFDVDERDLAVAISEVVASEMGRQTRAALNTALGRLD